jgi:hypothetical protein
MDKNISLLLDPPHILSPDVILTQSVTKDKNYRNESKSLLNCRKCEKVLTSNYYIFFGIPPSPCIIEAILCESINKERDKERSVMSDIQYEAKDFDIENKNKWIFSEHNVMSSKIRICNECYRKYQWPRGWHDPHFIAYRIRQVYFAVTEYQRRHTPIESTMSDYEKYVISLPDRSKTHWVAGLAAYGCFYDMESDHLQFMCDMSDLLKIALIPDYDKQIPYYKNLSQELRSDFIQDKERIVPNDQELTNWMKKYCNDNDADHRYNIEFCKVFTNPKIIHGEVRVYKIKYTVIVHYVDKDWYEFDI